MKRLNVIVEGQTEERFVKDCLTQYLAQYNVFACVRCVETSEDAKTHTIYRGGFRKKNAYPKVRQDIMKWLAEDKDPDCYFTTMFDYYALPRDFPEFENAQKKHDKYEQIQTIKMV